jgi:hypothetical protein
MSFCHVIEMTGFVSGMPAHQMGQNLRECEDQSWFKIQLFLCSGLIGVRYFRVPLKMSSPTPGVTRTPGWIPPLY